MALTAAIIVPTRQRAGYLDVALRSIVPQAAAAGAELLVVDDGPDDATRETAARHGARYLANDGAHGLNVARNAAIEATDADLLVYVDDDVEVGAGWLAALLGAANQCGADVGVFTGPIRARFEDHVLRMCGREGPPITFFDAGATDTDVERAWGANMALRRTAVERVGLFDERHVNAGDEEDWQARWRASGGRIRYVAAAAIDHRRSGDDARLGALCRAAHARGRALRRYDTFRGDAPPLRRELRVLAGCAVHSVRYRCANGIVMAAHSLGRAREALAPAPAPAPSEDFLSGASGTVGGRRGALLALRDVAADATDTLTARRRRLRRAAATAPPRRRVMVIGIDRPGVPGLMQEALVELRRSRHDVEVHTAPAGEGGKFENLNALLAAHPPADHDWLLVLDDDVALPRDFLDVFLYVAEQGGLKLAQPAHRLHSHAAWTVTRRRPGLAYRETTFVEIGPVTAFQHDTFAQLLPFPPLRMGWGLDLHWSAVARDHGWPIGVVDATPIAHTLRPAGESYPREEAIAEAKEFLSDRPYVRRDDVRTVREWARIA